MSTNLGLTMGLKKMIESCSDQRTLIDLEAEFDLLLQAVRARLKATGMSVGTPVR